MRVGVVIFGIGLLLCTFGVAAADGDAQKVVDRAKAEALTIPEQALALARLAWPDDGVDPAVSSLAREEIVGFGDRAIDALSQRLREADPRYGADITSALLETRLVVRSGLPHNYIPALYDALWWGSMDAKRLAMQGLATQRFPPALLPMIDAAYEYPPLTKSVVLALTRLGDDRARHYLTTLLHGDDPELVRMSADALASIGGRSIDVLRDASASDQEEIRGAAIDALVPVAGVDDLTILYEYVVQFPEDDPERIDLVIQRATQLESILEARQDLDAGTSSDF